MALLLSADHCRSVLAEKKGNIVCAKLLTIVTRARVDVGITFPSLEAALHGNDCLSFGDGEVAGRSDPEIRNAIDKLG